MTKSALFTLWQIIQRRNLNAILIFRPCLGRKACWYACEKYRVFLTKRICFTGQRNIAKFAVENNRSTFVRRKNRRRVICSHQTRLHPLIFLSGTEQSLMLAGTPSNPLAVSLGRNTKNSYSLSRGGRCRRRCSR